MQYWELLGIIGIAFIILEIFTPSMFFLNFAVASFITAALSLVYVNKFGLVIVFVILSFLSFAFLRPILIRRNSKETDTGIEGKYINKIAKVEEDVSENKGVISIYGERWEARTTEGKTIPKGCDVQIIKNDSLIMYVKKEED